MGAGGPFGSLQVPFMGNPRLQTAGAALGMTPPEQITTSPINGLLSLRGKLGGSATTPQVTPHACCVDDDNMNSGYFSACFKRYSTNAMKACPVIDQYVLQVGIEPCRCISILCLKSKSRTVKYG